jgi:PAS domain S-box-containing protein
MRAYRKFQSDEVELLTAIGNQVGLAIENARLYQQEQEFIEQLRGSEERYRELFENAHDAIWLHDLENSIIAANRSFVRLTGYTMEELQSMKAVDLVSEEFAVNASDIENPLYNGEGTGRLSEVILVRKDDSEAYVQLSTNPIFSEGQLVAFQHIARDITEEKRMRENQHFYVQQVTKAQEEERKRIARELHDDTTQELIVLSRELDDLASKSRSLSDAEKLQLHRLWQQTDSIIAGIKRLSQDLRPSTLDRLGLLPALEWLASNYEEHSGITVEFISHGDERQLDHDSELVLFRIAQEALNNVWRHSGASTARIVVEFHDRGTEITIEDNGQGFRIPAGMGDLAKEGKLGLAGIQERARLLDGTVSVQSKLGEGTVVTVQTPI